MNETANETGGTGPSHRVAEIGVAGVMALLALIGIYGSLQVGIGWGAEGPRAGFFPFYVSLIVLISCAVNVVSVLRVPDTGKLFAEWSQLRQVVSVLVPTAIYVALVPYIGIYVASALLIAFFMRWFGRYNWLFVDRNCDPGAGADVLDVRNLVPGAAAEGTARKPAGLLTGTSPRAFAGGSGQDTRDARDRLMFEDIGNLFHGFAVVAQPFNLVLMVVGIVLGVIVGVLPGLGGANGVAILLPLTFSMSPTSAIIMLSCIYWGALFGGAITSILFNIPGEPWSVATTFDGYPMAQKGRPARR